MLFNTSLIRSSHDFLEALYIYIFVTNIIGFIAFEMLLQTVYPNKISVGDKFTKKPVEFNIFVCNSFQRFFTFGQS